MPLIKSDFHVPAGIALNSSPLPRNVAWAQESCGSDAPAFRGRLLDFEEQVRMIAIAPAAADQGAKVPIDGFDHPEGDLRVAVSQDAVHMALEYLRQRREGRETLPAEGPDPGAQEAAGSSLVGIRPELPQLLPKFVGLGQAAIHREEGGERVPLVAGQVVLAGEEQPPLPPDQAAEPTALPEKLCPASFLDGLPGMLQDVEFV